MTISPKLTRLWKYGLVGLICGAATSWLALHAEELGGHLPGLIFGLGMAFLLERPREVQLGKWCILVLAFIGFSTTAYLMAVEIARRLYDLIPSGPTPQRLAVCGFLAGLFGAAKLTAVVQLTRLRAMSPWQWAVCPLTGGVFGLLLYPCLESPSLGLPEQWGPALLFIPWQTAVAMALMGFGAPVIRQSVMLAKGH